MAEKEEKKGSFTGAWQAKRFRPSARLRGGACTLSIRSGPGTATLSAVRLLNLGLRTSSWQVKLSRERLAAAYCARASFPRVESPDAWSLSEAARKRSRRRHGSGSNPEKDVGVAGSREGRVSLAAPGTLQVLKDANGFAKHTPPWAAPEPKPTIGQSALAPSSIAISHVSRKCGDGGDSPPSQ